MTATTQTIEERRSSLKGAWWVTPLLIIFGLAAVFWLVNLVIGGQCDLKFCVPGTLGQALRGATPIAFAALTGVVCERSGIVNIGIEGQMLMAAMVAYAVNVFSFQSFQHMMSPEAAGNLSRFLAIIAGVISSMLLGYLLAVVSIRYKVDQVIGGTVINMLSLGITGYFYRQFLAENIPAGPGTFPILFPSLSNIPIIGPILFAQKPLTYVMLICVVLLNYMIFFTPWGLRLRSVGEHPRAADTLGINVFKTRYNAVVFGSIFAGLGGCWFTLEQVDVFNPQMTNGLGFIGLAAMIFGNWNPFGALAGALIFGLGNSITATVSIFRPDIPSQIPQMLPYILTIIVLTGVVGRSTPPAAENQPYEKQ
ncbi:MAG TPA: ABC transporter permease [Anaerolineaceae bacterium]|nr:ABC transporter permease [Anaerolineaceae bacterium]